MQVNTCLHTDEAPLTSMGNARGEWTLAWQLQSNNLLAPVCALLTSLLSPDSVLAPGQACRMRSMPDCAMQPSVTPALTGGTLQVGAAAIEIWTMDDGYSFDNVVVSNSAQEAAEVRAVDGARHWADVAVRGLGARGPASCGGAQLCSLEAAEVCV